MRKSLREIFKTLFLVLASVNLGISSEMLPLGIIFALGFLYLHWRLEKPTPLYKKRFAYGAIVPYALWWVVTPEVENGISPYVVFIPAWYLFWERWAYCLPSLPTGAQGRPGTSTGCSCC